MPTVKVLSIDGGGIRGLIPALVLQYLERQTERPIAALFDLIAGTSTGGILALGLTKPRDRTRTAPERSAADLVALYVEHGREIFQRSVGYEIESADSWRRPKYPAAGIDSVLETYFGHAYLSEAIADVLVTSYEIEQSTRRAPGGVAARLGRFRTLCLMAQWSCA